MRQLMIDPDATIGWRAVPEPVIEQDADVLVRPLAVARCDLDLALALGLIDPAAMRGHGHPFGVGHEMCGEIVAVGSGVTTWAVGDRVIVPFQISCGCCERCLAGFTNACSSVPFGSAFGLGVLTGVEWGGALAELVRVPFADQALLAVPDGLSPVEAAGVPDNISDGYRCVAGALSRWPGGAVAVGGGAAPSVGLYAVASGRALGAGDLVYLDSDDERLGVAESLGAEVHRCSPAEYGAVLGGRRFAAVVDACNDDVGRRALLGATVPGGVCTSVWGPPRGELPLAAMYVTGVSYEIGRVNARATAPAVLDLIERGLLDPSVVPLTRVPIEEAAEGLVSPELKVVFE